MEKKRIKRVWVDSSKIYAETTDGLVAFYPLSNWKSLSNATEEELQDFKLSYLGIHWPKLNEDLSFEGLFYDNGFCQITDTEDSVYYLP